MATIPPLWPCPFCGEKTELQPVSRPAEHFVACLECGAEGPITDNEAEAVDLWNVRQFRYIQCTICAGAGKIHDPGLGYYGVDHGGSIICYQCNGSGQVPDPGEHTE